MQAESEAGENSMKWKQQYFIWNHSRSFGQGTGSNIRITEQGLTTSAVTPGAEASGGESIYYTRVCDSRKEGTDWDRLLLEGEVSAPDEIQITVYTCENDRIVYQGKQVSIQELVKSDAYSIEEKDRICQEYRRKELIYGRNQLLHGVTGRYFWLRIRLRPVGLQPVFLSRLQVFFPRMSWKTYLPEIYQNGDSSFLERYLEIFQTVYQEMEQRIEALPDLYSPEQTPSEWLVWLSQWISVEDPYLWQEEQLRYLIRHGMELSGIRGTVEYLKQMLWLYTGTIPYVVEYCQWAYEEMEGRKRRTLERLYGDNAYCVTIILEERAVADRRKLRILERLIRHCSPAHLDTRMEILQPYIFLSRHSYMGINSQLGVMGEVVLNGQNFLPFVVLKEKENQDEG